jgi:hypothetical protein
MLKKTNKTDKLKKKIKIYNGKHKKYKSIKWLTKQKNTKHNTKHNTKKRQTKKRQTKKVIAYLGGFKQNGGSKKLNYCYSDNSIGSVGSVGSVDPSEDLNTVEFNSIFQAPPKCIASTLIRNNPNRYIKEQYYYGNPGNYCYAITAIQLLRNIIDIIDYIAAILNSTIIAITDPTVAKNNTIFTKLLEILNSNSSDINQLLTEIATLTFPSNSTSQQDVTEFISYLNLADIPELQHFRGVEMYTNNQEFIKRHYKETNTQAENNFITNLRIEKHKINFNNLQEIFNYNQKGIILDNKNNFKNSDNNLEYINAIEFPIYFVKHNTEYILFSLVILLMNLTTNTKFKLNITIQNLNENLCIRKLEQTEINDNSSQNYNKGKGIEYELISIACHIGGPTSGHYVNFSKQIIESIDANKPKWIYYNDSGDNSYNSIKLTQPDKLKNTTVNGTNIYYLDNNNDINLIDQSYYTPYLFLYKKLQ